MSPKVDAIWLKSNGQLEEVTLGGGNSTPPQPALPQYDVIVGVIQSNVRGAAIDYGASDQYNDPRVEMWQWDTASVVSATEPLKTRDAGTGMGVMNTFVKDYLDQKLVPNRKILIVNAARGGTGLTVPSTNPGGTQLTWNHSATNDANNLAISTVTALNQIMATLPAGSRIVAYLANHGSTDGSNNTPKATFKSLLSAWITYLRTSTSTTDVPYLMMQMRPSLVANETRHRIIDEAQAEIANETSLVGYTQSPNGAEYNRDDSVHFNALGVRTIGHNLFTLYDSIV